MKTKLVFITLLFSIIGMFFSCQALLDSGVFSGGKNAASSGGSVPYEKTDFFTGAKPNIFGVSTDSATNLVRTKDLEIGTASTGGNEATLPPPPAQSEIPAGSVFISSGGGKGKIDLSGQSGIAYFYREVDASKNFYIKAQFKVINFGDANTTSWDFTSNGQEGFGIMARDSVNPNRASEGGTANMVLVGGYKRGVRMAYQEGIAGESYAAADVTNLKSGSMPGELPDTSKYFYLVERPDFPAGIFTKGIDNVVRKGAKAYNASIPEGGTVVDGETYTLTLKKVNGGFIAGITRPEAKQKDLNDNFPGYNATEYTYYAANDLLLKQEKDKYYLGFFTARNARVMVSNIEYYETNAGSDVVLRPEVIAPVQPLVTVTSAATTAQEEYTVHVTANISGYIQVKQEGNALTPNPVKMPWTPKPTSGTTIQAATYEIKASALKMGDNKFTVTFYPDSDKFPISDKVKGQQAVDKNGQQVVLTSTQSITQSFVVQRKEFNANAIYVAPNGKQGNSGSYDSPLDLETAIAFVRAGQEIILKDGTYRLKSVYIPRYNDGTIVYDTVSGNTYGKVTAYKKLIAENRYKAIIDFGVLNPTGFELWGSGWWIEGLVITNSADHVNTQKTYGDKVKGFVVSGHYNVISYVKTHSHGDTGLQISGRSTEPFSMWPSYNTVQFSESYNNRDAAGIDADGFAAKLTVGEGNKFLWCVSHNNIDDGWDLFAKKDSGAIGEVVIENCISYQNATAMNGEKSTSGGGNGFKLGGSGVPNSHTVRNSLSFFNKGNGFTSNSNPDIRIYNSTAYANGSSGFDIRGEGSTGVATGWASNVIDVASGGAAKYWAKRITTSAATEPLTAGTLISTFTDFYQDEDCTIPQTDLKKPGFIKRNLDGTFNIGEFMQVSSRNLTNNATQTQADSGIFSLTSLPNAANAISLSGVTNGETKKNVTSITFVVDTPNTSYVQPLDLEWTFTGGTEFVPYITKKGTFGYTKTKNLFDQPVTVSVKDRTTNISNTVSFKQTFTLLNNDSPAKSWNFAKLTGGANPVNAANLWAITDPTTVGLDRMPPKGADSTKANWYDGATSVNTNIGGDLPYTYTESENHIPVQFGGVLVPTSTGTAQLRFLVTGNTNTNSNNPKTGTTYGIGMNSTNSNIIDFAFVQGPFTIEVVYSIGTASKYPSLLIGNYGESELINFKMPPATGQGNANITKDSYTYTGNDIVPVKIVSGEDGNSSRIYDVAFDFNTDPITGISISGGADTIAANASATFTGTATPLDAEASVLTWEISPAYTGVSVDSAGKVTVTNSARTGTATLKLTAKGNISGNTLTTTKGIAITGAPSITDVTIGGGSATIAAGANATFTGTVAPTGSEPALLTWKINPAYTGVSADSTGKVTVASNAASGTATLELTAVGAISGTTFTKTQDISITGLIALTGVSIDGTKNIPQGGNATITPIITETGALNVTYAWSIEPQGTGISVDSTGKVTVTDSVAVNTTANVYVTATQSTTSTTIKSSACVVKVTEKPATTTYTLDMAGISTTANNLKTAGTDDYFKYIFSGSAQTGSINMGGVLSTSNYITFTTTGASTVVVTYSNSGSTAPSRYPMITDALSSPLPSPKAEGTTGAATTTQVTDTLTLNSSGTYFLGSKTSGIRIYKVVVTVSQ